MEKNEIRNFLKNDFLPGYKNEKLVEKCYEIVTLVNEKHSAGEYTIAFDASFLPSGIYIYKLEVSSFYLSKKMILLK